MHLIVKRFKSSKPKKSNFGSDEKRKNKKVIVIQTATIITIELSPTNCFRICFVIDLMPELNMEKQSGQQNRRDALSHYTLLLLSFALFFFFVICCNVLAASAGNVVVSFILFSSFACRLFHYTLGYAVDFGLLFFIIICIIEVIVEVLLVVLSLLCFVFCFLCSFAVLDNI